jgi:phenylalanyl-tRNA synthetase beta chain
MRIPINWLKEFVNLPKSEKDLTDKLTMVGHMLDKKDVVGGESIIDLELRGNRADCYSVYGIAREISAMYSIPLKNYQTIKLIKGTIGVDLNVKTPLVKRVGMITIKKVKILPSPKWLKDKLQAYGMESINNIVDLTNYVMVETGEPMHAFDLDKIGDSLEIRLASEGERITTFQDSVISLTNEDLVWAKGGQVLSVAGAVGEKYHSISPITKNILLEAANYDRANIRKTVYRHKLLTDAGIRHEKELDPTMVESAIGRFLYLIKKHKWGEFEPVFYDYYPRPSRHLVVELNLDQLENLGGVQISLGEVKDILDRLSFKVLKSPGNTLKVEVPSFRTDVSLPEDLIEEILRIYGYDKIPVRTLSLEIPGNSTPDYIYQEGKVKQAATSLGFDEIISLSFVKKDLSKLNVHPESYGKKVIGIVNAPSPDNKNLRITLLPNLFEHAKKAIYEREEGIRLFELGKIYFEINKKYIEERKVAFIYQKGQLGDFSEFKSYINGLFAKLNIAGVGFRQEPVNLPLTNSFQLVIGKVVVGYGGLMDSLYFVEIDLDLILNKEKNYKVSLWPKYPPQIEDITLTLPTKTNIGDVADLIAGFDNISKVDLKDTYKGSVTFRVWYQNSKKTLTDNEVAEIRKKLLALVKSKFGGTLKE